MKWKDAKYAVYDIVGMLASTELVPVDTTETGNKYFRYAQEG